MNAISWMLLAVIAAAFVWALVRTVRGAGGCGCSGDCRGCSGGYQCRKR